MKKNKLLKDLLVTIIIASWILAACTAAGTNVPEATKAPEVSGGLAATPTKPSEIIVPTNTSEVIQAKPTETSVPQRVMGEKLRIGMSASLTLLDPQVSFRPNEQFIHYSLFDSLAFRMPDMSIAPGLAKSWEMISDTEWVLKLQEGITFSNGEKFTADTVKRNVERVVREGFQTYRYLAAGLESADVIDEYTVKLNTRGPYPTLPHLLTLFFIVPPDYIDEVGDEAFGQKPIGSGPYTFVEWVKDSHVTLEANPNYWNDVRYPTFKTVEFRFLPDSSSRIAALQAGEVDIIQNLPPDNFDTIDADPKLDAVWVTSVVTPMFRFFPDSPMKGAEAIKDVRVRQAINYAIDVDAIMKGLYGGRGTRIATLMTPYFVGYDPSVLPYEYNPDKAKELLAEAGYPNGFELDFHTWSTGSVPQSIDLAQVAADYLGQVGIKANVIPIDMATALKMQYEKTLSPIHLWSWMGAELDCREKNYGIFYPASSANHIKDDVMVSLIDLLGITFDQGERNKICSQLQKRVHDQALIVPLFAQADIYGKSSAITWPPRIDQMIFPWEVTPAK